MPIKPWEELTIADDYMFKLVMRRKHICKRMLEKILRVRIRDIVYLEEEKTLKATYAGKGIRLDVYVADDKKTVFCVEMQVRRPEGAGLFCRTRYYQSMIDADLLAAGADYDELNRTYIIFICPFALFDGKRHLYTFRNVCLEDHAVELGDGTTKIFLSTKGKIDDVPADVKAFLEYIDGIASDDDFVTEIHDMIRKLKEQEAERVSYMTYAMKLMEERKEGREEGRMEGKMEAVMDLMQTTGWTIEKALEALKIPKVEWDRYKSLTHG